MTEVLNRFLRYVKIDTQSARESETYPSTAKQLDLAHLLVQELQEIGLSEVKQDQYGYVTATLPANITRTVPVAGFLAHMDTSPDLSGTDVCPQLVQAYDGAEIVLDAQSNVRLSPSRFPDLLKYVGQTLVTTDGKTLLGADDKAGIAEIMTAMAYLIAHPEIPHGKIKVGFTPDEEVGSGVDFFDVPSFGADFAFTLDGGEVGELEYENFNAAGAKVLVHGRNVHPGTAKGAMLNALLIGIEFNELLPVFERPEFTEKYEGFYHLFLMDGTVDSAHLEYIIRDHDEAKFNHKKKLMQEAANYINNKYGETVLTLTITDQYYNMKKMIEPHSEILEIAKAAYAEVGLVPKIIPVRGGTDGSRLSYMGLPTPNIFTGGHNAHGRYEFIPVNSMEKAVQVVVKVAELVARN